MSLLVVWSPIPMCVCDGGDPPTPPSMLRVSVGCPTIHLSYDTIYCAKASDSANLRCRLLPVLRKQKEFGIPGKIKTDIVFLI